MAKTKRAKKGKLGAKAATDATRATLNVCAFAMRIDYPAYAAALSAHEREIAATQIEEIADIAERVLAIPVIASGFAITLRALAAERRSGRA